MGALKRNRKCGVCGKPVGGFGICQHCGTWPSIDRLLAGQTNWGSLCILAALLIVVAVMGNSELLWVGLATFAVAWFLRAIWLRSREAASLGTGSPTVSHGPPSATESDTTCCLCGRTRTRWARLALLWLRCPECRALYCADCRALTVVDDLGEDGQWHWFRNCDHEWGPVGL